MRKISLLLFAFSALLFSSCLKDANLEMSDTMGVTIDGYVYDGETNEVVEGATITGSFGVLKSDQNGFYKISGLPMGDYRCVIEADGFMTMVKYSDKLLARDDFKGNSLVTVLETYMYKADNSLSTQLLSSVGGVKQVYANLPYTIELSQSFIDFKIEGITDANGMVVLEDTLPNTYLTIVVDTIIDEKHYSLNQIVQNPANAMSQYTISTMDVSADPFFITATNVLDSDGNTVDDMDIESNITFEFSMPIDPETVVARLASGNEVFVNVQVSGNVLTIDPIYSLQEGADYSISVQVDALDSDESESFYYNFSTEGTGLFYLTFTNVKDELGNAHEEFSTSSDIEFTFSQDLNDKNYVVSLIKNIGGTVKVLHDVTISGNKLTIKPEGNNLEKAAYYTAYITINDQNDNYLYSNSFDFRTEGDGTVNSLETPSGFSLITPSTVEDYTDYISFNINVDQNISPYDLEVYGNYIGSGSSDEFVEYSSIYITYAENSEGTIIPGVFTVSVDLTALPGGITIPANGPFADGNYFKLGFRATLGNVVSDFYVANVQNGDLGE